MLGTHRGLTWGVREGMIDMASCERCSRDMNETDGCDPVLFPDGVTPPTLYGDELGVDRSLLPKRCHDCSCRLGFSHHYGCDFERCPKCRGQLLGCPCWCDLLAGGEPELEIPELERMLGEDDD
jgi:hypothetical protein